MKHHFFLGSHQCFALLKVLFFVETRSQSAEVFASICISHSILGLDFVKLEIGSSSFQTRVKTISFGTRALRFFSLNTVVKICFSFIISHQFVLYKPLSFLSIIDHPRMCWDLWCHCHAVLLCICRIHGDLVLDGGVRFLFGHRSWRWVYEVLAWESLEMWMLPPLPPVVTWLLM